MTGKQIDRYLSLVNRRLVILLNSGIDWKPEYSAELAKIDQEIAALRPLIDEEDEHREPPAQVPTPKQQPRPDCRMTICVSYACGGRLYT